MTDYRINTTQGEMVVTAADVMYDEQFIRFTDVDETLLIALATETVYSIEVLRGDDVYGTY